MAMKIRKIEARKLVEKPKQKVAAYARVSMVTDRLEHSLSAQVSYYSDGAALNGEKITGRAPLNNGDVIGIGRSKYRVKIADFSGY